MQHSYFSPIVKNMYLYMERCRKSNNVWLHALMQSGFFILVLILSTLQPHFTLRLSARTLQRRFEFENMCMPQYFHTLPGFD